MLRPYQEQAIADVYSEWRSGHNSVLLQMPTGAGKTKTLAQIVQHGVERDRRIFVLAHRAELVEQLHTTLKEYGVNAGIVKSGYPLRNSHVQICSVQTLVNRLEAFQYWPPHLIVTDECHHSPSNSYRKIYNAFPDAKHLGVTATPCRIDGKPLGDVFDRIVLSLSIQELIELGYLVSPRYFQAENSFQGKNIGVARGDYKPSDLSKIVQETRRDGDLVATWMREANGLQTIVFGVGIEDSESIAKSYRDAGVSAAHIDGNTPEGLRRELLAKYASGEITVLSNVGIFTEGLDVPATGCIQLARPTKSVSLMFQMIGRALRPHGSKRDAIILDHAGILAEHGSVLDPRDWSLTESIKKNSKPKTLAEVKREENGLQVERLILEDKSIQLVEVPIGDRPAWLDRFQELLRIKANKGYKPGWVTHKLEDEFPELSQDDWKIVARGLGYHWKWAEHKQRRAA